MALRAELEMNGQKPRLPHRGYPLERDADPIGRSANEVKGGHDPIRYREHRGRLHPGPHERPVQSVDGTITIKNREEGAKMKGQRSDTASVVAQREIRQHGRYPDEPELHPPRVRTATRQREAGARVAHPGLTGRAAAPGWVPPRPVVFISHQPRHMIAPLLFVS